MINVKNVFSRQQPELHRKKNSCGEGVMVGVGGHPGQEQLRYSTPAMLSEGR